MGIVVEEAYASSNGDQWWVLVNPVTRDVSILHHPNASSGGAAKQLPVEDFLRIGGSGPEFEAVRRIVKRIGAEAAKI